MKKLLPAIALMSCAALTCRAQMPVRIGVRAGVNLSSIDDSRVYEHSVSQFQSVSMKPGFQVGVVVDIPMTSFLALQPGFYYDYRHNTYESMGEFHRPAPEVGEPDIMIARKYNGSVSTNWFHIPVLFSFRWTPYKNILQVQPDFGAYYSFGLGGRDNYRMTDYSGDMPGATSPKIKEDAFGKGDARYFRSDWGFVFGIGFEICNHYYIGAHYLAGVRNLARNKNAVNKSDARAWQFSVGYNF